MQYKRFEMRKRERVPYATVGPFLLFIDQPIPSSLASEAAAAAGLTAAVQSPRPPQVGFLFRANAYSGSYGADSGAGDCSKCPCILRKPRLSSRNGLMLLQTASRSNGMLSFSLRPFFRQSCSMRPPSSPATLRSVRMLPKPRALGFTLISGPPISSQSRCKS
jgi:hypothetical protein